MNRPLLLVVIVLSAALASPLSAQDDRDETGLELAAGLDLSAVAFRGDPAQILGDPEAGPGLGYWVRAGYGFGGRVASVGVELTAVATGSDEALGSLAMPFELRVQSPFDLGPVRPDFLIGYWFDQVSIQGEGDIDVLEAGPSLRYALDLGLSYWF